MIALSILLALAAVFVLGAIIIDDVVCHLFGTQLFPLPRDRHAISFRRVPLPESTRVIQHDLLVRIIGFGRAEAVTLGYAILVPASFEKHDAATQTRIIAHEASHVRDRARRGRMYLLIYLALYLRHGYARHPDELRADEYADNFMRWIEGTWNTADGSVREG